MEPGYDVWTHSRYLGARSGFVDSAREENKARAAVEIYLETGALGLHPFDTTKTKIETKKNASIHNTT